jgi:hypothetical protein
MGLRNPLLERLGSWVNLHLFFLCLRNLHPFYVRTWSYLPRWSGDTNWSNPLNSLNLHPFFAPPRNPLLERLGDFHLFYSANLANLRICLGNRLWELIHNFARFANLMRICESDFWSRFWPSSETVFAAVSTHQDPNTSKQTSAQQPFYYPQAQSGM